MKRWIKRYHRWCFDRVLRKLDDASPICAVDILVRYHVRQKPVELCYRERIRHKMALITQHATAFYDLSHRVHLALGQRSEYCDDLDILRNSRTTFDLDQWSVDDQQNGVSLRELSKNLIDEGSYLVNTMTKIKEEDAVLHHHIKHVLVPYCIELKTLLICMIEANLST